MELRVGGIVRESVVDGPGIRTVVFAQGCPRFCPDCHNPDSIDPGGGTVMEAEQIVEIIGQVKLIRGVTFSGGEPFMQAQAFAVLGAMIKGKGLEIMTYTGYIFEDLLSMSKKDQSILDLLTVSDYLVDGPFIREQKDLNLAFRGSANQRIVDVRASLDASEVILAPF